MGSDGMGLDDPQPLRRTETEATMNTPSPSAVRTVAADTPRSRVEYYRTVCHLPAVVQPDTGRIGFTAGMVWAVSMPADVGQMVKVELDAKQQGGGPIITTPRTATWTYLVRSDIPATMIAAEAALYRHRRITVLGNGDFVALPSPADQGSEYRGWITAAHSVFRPSGRAVLYAVHACLAPTRQPAL
ncbi:DNA-directed RNA polymerase subunit beta [Nocardia amikacinitolerans]|uniref:DNA-directed RNA polymerase subunit beta n=1 Tax=Nocardia amikacinitolerans TaxID=756689 RepID=UPI0020A328A4|nr:DNA-directed RNA polymerase subunit beta [Nocardia amikacinitolerans]